MPGDKLSNAPIKRVDDDNIFLRNQNPCRPENFDVPEFRPTLATYAEVAANNRSVFAYLQKGDYLPDFAVQGFLADKVAHKPNEVIDRISKTGVSMHFSFDADGKLKSLDTRDDHNCLGHAEYLPDGKIRSADLLMTDPEDSQAVIPLLGNLDPLSPSAKVHVEFGAKGKPTAETLTTSLETDNFQFGDRGVLLSVDAQSYDGKTSLKVINDSTARTIDQHTAEMGNRHFEYGAHGQLENGGCTTDSGRQYPLIRNPKTHRLELSTDFRIKT
jgi:hypothetical protein